MPDLPPNHFLAKTRDAWRAWLAEHHQRDEGIWLVRYKKNSGKPYLSYEASVQEALCFGWIDSLPRKLDEARTLLYFAPRKAGSGWSRVNKNHIEKMLAADKITEAGLAKIETAKTDGSWEKLDAVENLEIPEDLIAAFERFGGSAANFAGFPRSAKRGILEWILNAKRDTTRSKRVEETARLAAENIRANSWPKPKKSASD